MIMPFTLRKLVLCTAAIAVLALPSLGQTTTFRSIEKWKVSPAHAGDFQAAIKEYRDILKKAGATRAITLWASASGPGEISLVMVASKLADLDQDATRDPKLKDYAGQLSSIAARIAACIESYSRIIDQTQPDLTMTQAGSDRPGLARVLRVVVKSDRTADFLALAKSDLLPAARQSGVKSYTVSQTRFGGLYTEFRLTMGVDSWTDLDGVNNPLHKAMGDEKWASFQKKFQAMTVEGQYDVYRYLPDLSYIPASATSTSSQ
jgi:hypothetical protein